MARAIAWTCAFSLVALLAAGCSSWKETHGTVPAVLGEKPRDRILVKLADGSKVVVRNPEVCNDSLFGTLEYSVIRESDRFRAPVIREGALALADIQVVEVRKGDALKVVGLGFGALGVVALAGLIALLLILSSVRD